MGGVEYSRKLNCDREYTMRALKMVFLNHAEVW